ncbi:Sporulation-specific protein [Wickerhamomyces ciferrii]|uniref:Sporulation-specific protein n=1 Tax=Wickerhamomyces ciferrii (strain ATCC 14091 / BCRC 22168 / CBS 111 / JCM 3599 / NBRC 0793 / NRRL Y-1031 F-60-10) TaxID=1206466 RepID=K0KFE3_WICCF|nr:Sporulation-specific protein [Wickerhamomyces ciferrii]CCH43840.1 Sporulation-specific protein [Wickerhamomyces ciferrii]
MNTENFNKRGHYANYEFQREIELLLRAESVIDLLEVGAIHKVDSLTMPPHVRAASNFAWNESADIKSEPEETKDSYLQLVFQNGTCSTFKAPDRFIRDEWVSRLNALMNYWKERKKEDTKRINEIKLENIERLNTDEGLEANVGESTPKWENSRGVAEPTIHNINSNAMLRPVVRSDMLFQKPKKRSSFKNYYVVLVPGFIILYRLFVRGLRGLPLPTTHYDHYSTIPIIDCYVYSGNTSGIYLLDRDSGIDKVNQGCGLLP